MVTRRHSRTGAALVAAGLIVGATGVTGCSVGGPFDDSLPSDPVALLHRAAPTLVRAGSSKARTEMEMATGGTRVTIHGEGVYDYGRQLGRLKVLLPHDPTGRSEHRPITELLAPGALFMKNRGAGVPTDKWVRVDTGTLSDGNLVTGGATDPFAAAEVLRGTRTATFVGETEIDGTRVRHYRGTADLTVAARAASEGNRAPCAPPPRGSPPPRSLSTPTSTTRAASGRCATASASSTAPGRARSPSLRRPCCTTSAPPSPYGCRDPRTSTPERSRRTRACRKVPGRKWSVGAMRGLWAAAYPRSR